MADYIIGGILAVLALLALRSVFKKQLPAVAVAAAAVVAALPAVTVTNGRLFPNEREQRR